MAELVTERLRLRAPKAADAGWIAAEISRPQVQCMLTSPPDPNALADAETWVAQNRAVEGNFVIEAKAAPVGVITLESAVWGGELGYWLARNAWGRGYMSEAARAVLAWHFAGSGEDVPSGHIIDNRGSRNGPVKLGCEDRAVERRHCHFRGEAVDSQRMVLVRDARECCDGH